MQNGIKRGPASNLADFVKKLRGKIEVVLLKKDLSKMLHKYGGIDINDTTVRIEDEELERCITGIKRKIGIMAL